MTGSKSRTGGGGGGSAILREQLEDARLNRRINEAEERVTNLLRDGTREVAEGALQNLTELQTLSTALNRSPVDVFNQTGDIRLRDARTIFRRAQSDGRATALDTLSNRVAANTNVTAAQARGVLSRAANNRSVTDIASGVLGSSSDRAGGQLIQDVGRGLGLGTRTRPNVTIANLRTAYAREVVRANPGRFPQQ